MSRGQSFFRKVVVVGGSLGVLGGVTNLARNDWDINAIGAVRLGRAVYAAATITWDYKFNVYSRNLEKEDPQSVEEIWESAHRRSAQRLLDLCKSNRGVFVKVGQHLGALDYLLPPPYIETLRVLHSQAPSSSLEDVYKVIKKDLCVQDVGDLFSEFDTRELGAASLAQVYKAKLKSTGETVAVKVQHANVRAHSYVDMKTMEFLVRTAAYLFPDFKLLWLMDETKKNLPKELDFLHEAKNADMLRNLMTHCKWLKIPKVYWDLSTERVLIMEYCQGGQINDLPYYLRNGICPRDVSEKVGTLYSEMIFQHGFVHCDPHPGNLLVHKDKKTGKVEVSLLDHGLYTTLSPEFRYNYANFWLSIINREVEGIREYGVKLGVGELYGLFACMVTARSWDSLTSKNGVAKQVTAEEEQRIRKNIGGFLPQISEILENVPRPMILIFKTNDLIRGIEHALKTSKTMKSFTTMSKFCISAVYSEDFRRCEDKSFWCYRFKAIEAWMLTKITLYEMYLWGVEGVGGVLERIVKLFTWKKVLVVIPIPALLFSLKS